MKLTGNTRKSMTVGASSMVIQDINLNNTKAVISILRDKIYTDKPKAAITETLCNAIDEHRKYNVKRPVDVIITSSNLIIRDYAKGLDEAGVTKVFFQYMNSTKSDNDIDIGGYGIGAKAPSSYTSTWYVISYHGGKKTTYMSTIDGDVGKTYKMLEQECDVADTGICVTIPIEGTTTFSKNAEINTFLSLASDLRNMIGGYTQEKEVECYYFPEDKSNIKDYDDFEKATNEELEAGKSLFFNDHNTRDLSLKDFLQRNETQINNNKFIYYLIPNEILILKNNSYRVNSIFASSFFSSTRMWAYDGDICYSIKVPKDIKDKYHLNTSNSTFIFLFKRGEMSIAPTREDISMSSKVASLLEAKLAALDKELNDKLVEKFDQFIKEKNTVFRSYTKINNLVNLDFNNYNHNYNKALAKYPTLHCLVSKSKTYIPRTNNGVLECVVEEKLDKNGAVVQTVEQSSINAKRYNHWDGYNVFADGEIVFLVTESNIKHKSYYKAELVKAVVAYRQSLGLPFDKHLTVVIIDKEETLQEHIKATVRDATSLKLIRKDVEWFHIDDIAGLIPKRTVKRVKTTTNPINNKTQTTKVVSDIWRGCVFYNKEDLKGKKVLGILASDLASSESYWKTFKTDIYGNSYKDWRAIFSWLSGYDCIVKVYKEDVSYWTQAGVTIAPQDEEFRKNIILEGAKKHSIIAVPWSIESLSFLDNNNYLKKHIKDKLNLSCGSSKVINNIFDMYEVGQVINLLCPTYLGTLRTKLSEVVKEKIKGLSDKDKEALNNALVAHSIGIDSNSICVLSETAGEDLGAKTRNYISTIRKKAYKEAEHVYQYLVKNIDFSLN